MKKLELLANICVYLTLALLIAAIITGYTLFAWATVILGVIGLILLISLEHLTTQNKHQQL